MTALHPAQALYSRGKSFPALAACEHYAGSEKLIRKALQLQVNSVHANRPIFDITADCEDGASVGNEEPHAQMVANIICDSGNHFDRVGARIHDIVHPHWRRDLDIIIGRAGERVAYIVLPKVNDANDVQTQINALNLVCKQRNIQREIPVHVLIETPGALHDVWAIAAMPQVESIDFGLMDFVSEHCGAIPASAMQSPGQFDHPLIVRAKCEIAAAALGNGIIPAHNVTTELRDTAVVKNDASRAYLEFGFLRMWSIHPNQIQPIVEAMQPDFADVTDATTILCLGQDAAWGPTQHAGRLHDRASYRYYWEVLRRAHITGMRLPVMAMQRFFT
ncbi:MAG: CoA ester lyase [Rhodocyclaceae bacterium]|nr:CoA ester lyase [Rhodocyclaceae bacterium]MBL0077416.1 CoA ester lyase [Rhodocyclaceae bacterium]